MKTTAKLKNSKMSGNSMHSFRTAYQVVTKDGKHHFSERTTFELAKEHLFALKSSKDKYAEFDYEILMITETITKFSIWDTEGNKIG